MRTGRRLDRSRNKWRIFTLAWLAMLLYASVAPAHDWLYTARPGDNIWNLTETHLTSIRYWKRLQSYNKLENPDRIRPGTRLRIPIQWLKVQPASARLVELQGAVQRLQGDGTSQPAAKGDELRSGDGLRTGADSSATLEFADRSRLLVQAETELVMDTMSAYGTTGMVDTSMRLHGGRVENDVTPAVGEGSRYRIITPSAVVAVRGTRFRSAFDPASGIALGEVTQGGVAVRGDGGEARVPAGFGTRAVRGAPPEAPRALLPAPDPGSGAAPETRLLIEAEWPEVEGAVGYRVQLFAQGDPAPLVFDTRVETSRVELDAPPDGRYRLRVRGIDAVGLEGLNGERELVVDARPVPPTLLGPAANARMHGQAPAFWWSQPQGIDRYHLQLARDEAFSDRLLDEPALVNVRHALDAEPAPGTYYWRAASVSAEGERGPFSDPRPFTVLAVPAAAVAESNVSENGALITWGRVANAGRYEFELARDEAFEDVVVQETTSQTEMALPGLDADTYFYRVRGVSDEDVAGPYGTVNRLEIPGEPLSPSWLLLLAPLLLIL